MARIRGEIAANFTFLSEIGIGNDVDHFVSLCSLLPASKLFKMDFIFVDYIIHRLIIMYSPSVRD